MHTAHSTSLIASLAFVGGCFHASQSKPLTPADPALEPRVEQSPAEAKVTVTSAEPTYVALLIYDSGVQPSLWLSRSSRNDGATARAERHEFVLSTRHSPDALPTDASVKTCTWQMRYVRDAKGNIQEAPEAVCEPGQARAALHAVDQYAVVVVSDHPIDRGLLVSKTSQVAVSSDPETTRHRLAERLFAGRPQRWSIDVIPLELQ